MSRWWKRRDRSGDGRDASVVGTASHESELSEVRLVKRPDRSSEVLAELSAAFADGRDEDDEDDPDITDVVVLTGSKRAGSARRHHDGPTTIAIVGDDDLPDAVYLDDGFEGDAATDTVFIEDDGTGDAVQPNDATGPGIEPRLRQRRIGVRREQGRRRLRRFAIVTTILVVVVGVLATLGSGWFAVADVDVTGVRNADSAAIDAVVDDLLDTPVLLVDTADAERRLGEIAWVEDARVRTDFPNSATVEIRERTPVATVQGTDARFRILDDEGRVLDVIDGQPVEFVLISGPPVGDLEPGSFTDVGHAAAASIATKLTPAIRSRLVSVSTTTDGSDLRFVLSNEPGPNIEVRLGAAIGDNDQIERLVRLQRALDDVVGSETTAIDVTTAQGTSR